MDTQPCRGSQTEIISLSDSIQLWNGIIISTLWSKRFKILLCQISSEKTYKGGNKVHSQSSSPLPTSLVKAQPTYSSISVLFLPFKPLSSYVSQPHHLARWLQFDELIYAMVLIGENDGQPVSHVCILPKKFNTEPKNKNNVRVVPSGGRYILEQEGNFNITL